MTYVLHLGHQLADVAGADGNISTTSGSFDPAYDVNGLRWSVSQSVSRIFNLGWKQPATTEIWIQFRYRSPNASGDNFNNDLPFVQLYDADGELVAEVTKDDSSGAEFRVRAVGDTSVVSTGSQTQASDTVYWFNIRVKVADDIEIDLYNGETLVASAVASNTTGGKGVPVQMSHRFLGLHDTFNSRVMAVAHYAVLDGVSTLGRRFVRKRPNTAANYEQWAGAVGALADGDLATRMSSDTAGQRQSFDLAGPSVSATTVAAVHAVSRGQAGTEGVDELAHFLRIGGTDYDSAAEEISPFFPSFLVATWDENPATSTAWDDTNLPTEVGLLSGASV